MKYFNKSFFKMAAGFILIIILGLTSLFLINRYGADGADNQDRQLTNPVEKL